MSQRTSSEELFEQYCAKSGIEFSRIAEEQDQKRPDYEVLFRDLKVVVEVKEITPNPEERVAKKQLPEKVSAVTVMTPGKRIRKKISDASPQIKAATKGNAPSLLVLFDEGQTTRHLDAYHVLVAMHGFQQLHIIVPNDMSQDPEVVGKSFGPGKKMTEDQNTSISALGVLGVPGPDQISLLVYHNLYAAVPIPVEHLAGLCTAQYEVSVGSLERTEGWSKIDAVRA
jgi:hypothetical protein